MIDPKLGSNFMNISRYTAFLEQVLTPGRLKHCQGVMQVMEELSGVYTLDREQAITAGLLHDAAKDLPTAQQQQLIAEAGLEFAVYSEQDYNLYLHGPVGAHFVKKELGITDPLILDAIYMHSFCGEGANFRSTFVWCLRFADILDPYRTLSDGGRWSVERDWFQEGREKQYQLVFSGKLKEAAYHHTGWVFRMFEEKGFPIHPNMRRVYQELSIQV